jgi:4-carboxymuconolactone decarboxylase
VRDELLAEGGERALIGPVGIWLNNPELARRAASLGLYIARQLSLPRALREIAILVTARVWTSQYEWYEHSKLAKSAGIKQEVVDAIKRHQRPEFESRQQQIAYDVSRSILERHVIDDALYAEAVDSIGEAQLLELIALLGMYTFVSITLNAFQVPIPLDAEPLPE